MLCGALTVLNLATFAAGIGLIDGGLVFLIMSGFLLRKRSREVARLAGEIGLTTKVVKYVKNPVTCSHCGASASELHHFCTACGSPMGTARAGGPGPRLSRP